MTEKSDDADYGLLTPAWPATKSAATTSDRAFVQAMLDVETQWGATLIDAGFFPSDIRSALEGSSNVDDYSLVELSHAGTSGGNPLIPLVSQLRANVAAQNPAAAAAVHVGATSQDIIDSALMLLFKRSGEQTLATIKHTVRTMEKLARQHKATPMVARSLTQHSLPATFGWRVSHWLQALAQAGQALEAQLENTYLQWGGAAGTKAALTEFIAKKSATTPTLGNITADSLAENLATKLGLHYVQPWQANRIHVLQAGFALAQVIAACAKIANDVLISARTENGELAEPVVEGRGGSSAMPHKQNPVLSILIKNAGQASVGDVANLQQGATANVEERADGAWHTEWSPLRNLMRSAGAVTEKTSELLAGLRVFEDRMAHNLARHGTVLATERLVSHLAPRLEETGHTAPGHGKMFLQKIITTSLQKSLPLEPLLQENLPPKIVTATELQDLLDPSAYTGEAEEIVETIIATYTQWSHS